MDPTKGGKTYSPFKLSAINYKMFGKQTEFARYLKNDQCL